MDRGAWWATVHGSHKESDTTKQLLHTHTHTHTVNLPLYSTKKSKDTEVGLQDNLKVAFSMVAILIF